MRFQMPQGSGGGHASRARGCLVAFIGGLGEELQHNVGDRRGIVGERSDGGVGWRGDVAVDPLPLGSAGDERHAAVQHSIERDAEG